MKKPEEIFAKADFAPYTIYVDGVDDPCQIADAYSDMIDALIEAYKEASDYKLSKETASRIEQALKKAGVKDV